MTVTYQNLQYMWNQVILPRVGDVYVFGGSLSPTAVQQGTDCTGACSEVNEALLYGPDMDWTRQFWTGTFEGAVPGNIGPFGNVAVTTDWVCIDKPQDAPADAAAIFSCLQLPDPSSAHMVCAVPAANGSGWVGIESGGSYTENGQSVLHISPTATSIFDPMFNQFFYLKGPIVNAPWGNTATGPVAPVNEGGGTMGFQNNVTDTLFADVSQFQVVVDNTYTDAGYRVLSIRSNDGTYDDTNFAANYQWCVEAVNDGRLKFFIVYCYWRSATAIPNMISLVNAQGGPHSRMVAMMDVESGGNADVDQSTALNTDYNTLVTWLGGNEERVIAYANYGDERTMWQFKPPHLDWILAGYGSNPSDPSLVKLAHQYTDGQGYGAASGLPDGAPPFGNCDMNSADGLSVDAFAAAVGLGPAAPPVVTPPVVAPPVVAPPVQQQPGPLDTDAAVQSILWKETFLLDLTDRPRDPTLKDDQYGWVLNTAANVLVNQALLTALCEAAKIDVASIVASVKAAITPPGN